MAVLPYGRLIASNSFKEIERELQNLPVGSIVLLDADNVLVQPEDQILRDPYHDEYKTLRAWYKIPQHIHPFTHASYCSVEPRSVEWVRSLKSRGMYVIAFTAVEGRHQQRGDFIPDWRSAQLRQLQFEFSDNHREISFPEMSDPEYNSLPLFKEGILYAAKRPKGDVFQSFIEHEQTPKRFPHVVLIDDMYGYLASVAEKVRTLGIPFTGVCYHRAWSCRPPLDRMLAHRQMFHLQQTKRWVSKPSLDSLELSVSWR